MTTESAKYAFTSSVPSIAKVPSVSVIVPVFNEHKTLERVVERLLALPFVTEVVVVDDGSNAETNAIIDSISTRPRVKLLRHVVNRGKGAALKTGFGACLGEIVVVQDADLEYYPEDIERVVHPIATGAADVVFGSRAREAHFADAPWERKAANRLLTWLSNQTSGLQLTDMETGRKAFARKVVTDLILNEERFGIEPEITAKVAAGGWRVQEVPINYLPRGYVDGKKIGFRDGLVALWCIVRYSRGGRQHHRTPAAKSGLQTEEKIATFKTTPTVWGITLFEALVFIAIVGMVIAICLTAVQVAQDSASRVSTSNSLRQTALSEQLRTYSSQHFLEDGWSQEWVGDSGLCFGLRQPDGWVHNVLLLRGTSSNSAVNTHNSHGKRGVFVSGILLYEALIKTLAVSDQAISTSQHTVGEAPKDRPCMYAGHRYNFSSIVSEASTGHISPAVLLLVVLICTDAT